MGLNISRLLFAAILIAVFTAGALLSYLWVVGYYVSLELKVPDKPLVYLHDFMVSAEDPSFFNISILNPSFSPKKIKVLGIQILTSDGKVHSVTAISPNIPKEGYILEPGMSETFRCSWSWANYTGQRVNILVLVEEGSGGLLQAALPLTEIEIKSVTFDPELGGSFNMTVVNSSLSAANVTLTKINVVVDDSVHEVAAQPALPVNLEPNASINLICNWSWAEHQGESVLLVVETAQGYFTEKENLIPTYVVFTIQKIEFDPNYTSRFKLTIINSEDSLVALKITDISVRVENGSAIRLEETIPDLPYVLDKNSTVSFLCMWNWTAYRGKRVVITTSTEQGYKTKATQTIP